MTRSQIISTVQALTEGKLTDAQVDYELLYAQAIQEFCGEARFWWRKKNLTFATVAATSTYDLTDLTNVPTVPAGAGLYIAEITKIIVTDSVGNVSPVDPVFDDESVAGIIQDTSKRKPDVYTIDTASLTAYQVLRFPLLDAAYTARVFFWAMPNPTADNSDDVVYIVPTYLHHCLVTALEKEVWRSVFGAQDPKYTSAKAQYDKKVEMAKEVPAFSTGYAPQFSSQSNEAIRSTRP
jgi:hypothetical protein